MKEVLLHEGKAKKVFKTDDPDKLLVHYKDDATAFNGKKKGSISNKGKYNNKISNYFFKYLEEKEIPTHYIEEISDRETIVKNVEIVPLEAIVRNVAAGSMARKLGLEEGKTLLHPTTEFSYKDDDLGDPLIADSYATALGITTNEELKIIIDYSLKVNELLKDKLLSIGIKLVDFKLEFGRYKGKIILADEISPDTCRFWDAETNKKLDKDRFRQDLGEVESAYEEIYNRLTK